MLELTLENVKNIIEKSEPVLSSLCPALDNPKSFLLDVLSLVEKAISEENLPSLPEDYPKRIDDFVGYLIESLINCKCSSEEAEVTIAIATLFVNLNNVYPGCILYPLNLKVLMILSETVRTLEENLILCSYMNNYIKMLWNVKSTNSLLTEKYYSEFEKYLKE